MGIAKDIVRVAEEQLKAHIVFEGRLVYNAEHKGQLPNFAEDEEWVIDAKAGEEPKITMYSEWDGDYVAEKVKVKSLHIALDDMVYAVWGEDEDEADITELSVDDMQSIAEWLESRYEKLV